jgi:hypothetical protein
MKITIAQRFRPFCHLPGTVCVLPFSQWTVQTFPTKILFTHLKTGDVKEYSLDWRGPVANFTTQLDLERGGIVVFGHTQDGYRKVSIQMKEEGIVVGSTVLQGVREAIPPSQERLSLGVDKKLDWELVYRRLNLCEIFPLWFRLGQMVPSEGEKVGVAALIQEYDKNEVFSAYRKIFLAGFYGLLAPRLSDSDYQGIVPDEKCDGSPLFILSEGSRFIRRLFFDEWSFLPNLPPQCHAGRFVHLQTKDGDIVDLEWSKKMVRRVVISPKESKVIVPKFQRFVKSFRLRRALKDRGDRQSVSSAVELFKGQVVYLDCFEK